MELVDKNTTALAVKFPLKQSSMMSLYNNSDEKEQSSSLASPAHQTIQVHTDSVPPLRATTSMSAPPTLIASAPDLLLNPSQPTITAHPPVPAPQPNLPTLTPLLNVLCKYLKYDQFPSLEHTLN